MTVLLTTAQVCAIYALRKAAPLLSLTQTGGLGQRVLVSTGTGAAWLIEADGTVRRWERIA